MKSKFQGNEIFEIQKATYEQMKGIFGLSERNIKIVAVALDAAVTFGMLMRATNRTHYDEYELYKTLKEKLERLQKERF